MNKEGKKQGSAKKSPTKTTIAKKEKENTSSYFISLTKWFIFLTAVMACLTSYHVYNMLFSPPPMLHFDGKFWWGPYPINPDQDISIRPFRVEFSDVMINDLRERLMHRRPFTPPLENTGFTYGFNTNFLNQVLDYWQNKYDFKEREQFFNKFDHFITNVQGLDIHYIHVKPKVDPELTVVPVLLLHGWPGSVREFYDLISKLTTPRSGHKIVFEVIAPSLPGYGFSQAASRAGLGPAEIAIVMRNLMKRIGHEKYYIQGGDWGHIIGSNMATLFPENILGFHTNIPIIMHPFAVIYAMLGSLWPSWVVQPQLENRMYPLSKHWEFLLEEFGYVHLQATKPDTIGVALTDSPAGLVAYILEKFSTWTDPSYRQASDGKLLAKYSLTHLLDNVMVYWCTNSITSSMRLYAEAMSKRQLALKMDFIPTEVPTWGIKFKHELMFQPDRVLRVKFINYIQSTVAEGGGHFAALENPEIVAHDFFAAVETFRLFHATYVYEEETEEGIEAEETAPKTIYDFTVTDIHGRDVKLDRYRGHVTLIVNVASECGLTDKNYKQLNELYEKYSQTRGLRILAFPCNQFGSQEPGTAEDIFKFAKSKEVKFDLFQKVDVNGDDAHPLWKFLKTAQGGTLGDFIKWNFSKFIIDKDGVPVERLGPHIDPLDLEPYLARYW